MAGACIRVVRGGDGEKEDLTVPQQTKRWYDTVLGNDVLVTALGGEMPVSPTCGKESPVKKKKEKMPSQETTTGTI